MKKGASFVAVFVALVSILTSPIWGPPICRAVGACHDDKPMTGADCLVGEWEATITSGGGPANIGGEKVLLTGPNPPISYRHGRFVVEYGSNTLQTGMSGGHRYERLLTGSTSNDYTVEGDQIVYTNADGSSGRYRDSVDGTVVGEGVAGAINGEEKFDCSGDTLTTYGTSTAGRPYTQTWRRKS